MKKKFYVLTACLSLLLVGYFSFQYLFINKNNGQRDIASTLGFSDSQRSAVLQSKNQRLRLSPNTGGTTPTTDDYPLVSPNNPIQPRLSSIQQGDNPFLNLTRNYNKAIVNLPEFPEALCNDGTKPVYYHKQGFGSGSKRWIIWLEGGGYCSSSDPNHELSCTKRDPYLTTSNDTPALLLDFEGMLKKSHTENPDFYSYNMVLVHYCSSDLWGGIGEQKVMNDLTGQKYWYSGSKIVQAVIQDLKNKKGLSEATNVIFTGTSAGAAGVNLNTEKVREMLSPTTDMVSVIDALWGKRNSVFYSSATPEYERTAERGPIYWSDLFQYVKMDIHPRCLQAISPKCAPNEKCARWDYRCGLPADTARYLSVPFYATNDTLDVIIGLHFRVNMCNLSDPQDYMPWYTEYTQELAPSKQKVTGFFETGFGQHGIVPSQYWSNPSVTLADGRRIAMKDSFGAWYFNRNNYPKIAMNVPNPDLYPHQQLTICPRNQTLAKSKSKLKNADDSILIKDKK